MSEVTPPNGEASSYKKRKRQVLNIKEKCDIIEKLKEGQTVMNISRAYGVCRSTIWGIKHNELKILKFSAQIGTASNLRKTMKKCEDHNMECAVLKWYNEQTGNGVVVSNQMICDAALRLNKQFNGELEFKATRGWLTRFKARHDIGNKHKAGDDISSVVDTEEDSLNGTAVSGKSENRSKYEWETETANREKIEDRSKYEWETETANRENSDSNNATAEVLPAVNIKEEEPSEILIDDDQKMNENENPPIKPSHEEAFNAIDTVIQWAEAQREIGMDQLMFLRTIQGLAAKRALASISRVK